MLLGAIRIAVRSLLAARLRSALTALGILIGTAAVVVVVALGTGARQRISEEISKIGNNSVFAFPQSTARSGVRGAGLGLTSGDAEAIRREATAASAVTVWSNLRARVHSSEDSHLTGVMGVDIYYFDVRAFALADGRNFSTHDVRTKARVAIIGQTVKKELFGRQDPVGRFVRIGRHTYEIIGLLAEKGRSPFEDQDDRVLLPITSWRSRLAPLRGDQVGLIMGSAKSSAHAATLSRQIEAILRQRHRIGKGEPDDFVVRSQEQFRKAQDEILDLVTNLLLTVAVVALFIGGVGVMNIMLVGVAERTREIGVRMSVGASQGDILLQFLVESVLLTQVGGALGVALAGSVAFALTRAFGWGLPISSESVVVALLASSLVGVLFGLLPARLAARLDPALAVRKD